MTEIKLGFPNEGMTPGGDYVCNFVNFARIAIHRSFTFLIWIPWHESRTHRIECDGLMHAVAEIYHLLEVNKIEHTLPLEVIDE